MKLYATTTSERATKGQGGNNYLKIEVKDEKKEVIMKIDVDFTIKGLDYTFWADPRKLREVKEKGEKQKGEKVNHCIECGVELPEEWDGYCYKCCEHLK